MWRADTLAVDVDTAACHWRGALPSCPHCGGLARPNILMFGDGAWLPSRSETQAAGLHAWLRGVPRLVVVELGAGVHVPSVRHFSHQLVHQFNARLIRINPRDAQVAGTGHCSLPLGALRGLQGIEAAWQAMG
jgi:NAD-dependent SIR2 family protein deacetylase